MERKLFPTQDGIGWWRCTSTAARHQETTPQNRSTQINPSIHSQDLVWQRSQFEAFGRTKDDHVSLMTKRKFLRFD